MVDLVKLTRLTWTSFYIMTEYRQSTDTSAPTHCGSLKDIMSQVKEHVRDVQSALRRRKGDLIIDASFLKKLTKDTKKIFQILSKLNTFMAQNH
ncbi:hypothetical protein Hanom_Chr15g01371531 [Helianthus anomalus]